MGPSEKVKNVGRKMVRDASNGCGPLSRLEQGDIASLVATYAPYGHKAREAFFALLRETADRNPCQYD